MVPLYIYMILTLGRRNSPGNSTSAVCWEKLLRNRHFSSIKNDLQIIISAIDDLYIFPLKFTQDNIYYWYITSDKRDTNILQQISNMMFYYMTSDNVFSDRLTSLVTFFNKTLYSTRKKSRELNITFQRSSRHLKIKMVFPNYLKSSSQSSSG